MVKYLLIAGHGKQRDGSFDPGATGVITKGEHKYMRDDLFPAMKRYVPKGADIIFYDALKVSNHGNLLQLVKQYKADQVIEFHYDAAVKEARGGHVIIHTDYAPDNLDLRLRDAISDLVGVRYTHKGHKGISGRSNLYNVNVARKNGVTYRLLELGFGTNKQDADIMTQQVNGYAKRLMEAIVGEVSTPKPDNKPKPPITNPQKKSSAVVAQEVIDGNWGTNPQRKSDLEKAGYNYTEVQGIVNRLLGTQQSKPKPVAKSIDQLAKEVIDGKHGQGEARKKALGSQYSAVQAKVNAILGGSSKPRGKTVDQMAREVVAGKHGNGHAARQKSLGISNAEYQKVRARVNQLA